MELYGDVDIGHGMNVSGSLIYKYTIAGTFDGRGQPRFVAMTHTYRNIERLMQTQVEELERVSNLDNQG